MGRGELKYFPYLWNYTKLIILSQDNVEAWVNVAGSLLGEYSVDVTGRRAATGLIHGIRGL
jgi:hypothetical protein